MTFTRTIFFKPFAFEVVRTCQSIVHGEKSPSGRKENLLIVREINCGNLSSQIHLDPAACKVEN